MPVKIDGCFNVQQIVTFVLLPRQQNLWVDFGSGITANHDLCRLN